MKRLKSAISLFVALVFSLNMVIFPVGAVNLNSATSLSSLKTASFANNDSSASSYLFKITLPDAGKISFFRSSANVSSSSKLAVLNSNGKTAVSGSFSDMIGKSVSISKKGTYYAQVTLAKSQSVKGFGYTYISNSGKSVSKSVSLKVGKSYDFSSYSKDFSGKLKWVTSKKSVVKVNAKGIVTAVKIGNAKIKVYSSDGDYAQISVAVSESSNKTDYVDVKSALIVDRKNLLNIYYDLRGFQRIINNQRIVADPDVYNDELGRYEYTDDTTARVDTSKSISSSDGKKYYLVVGGKFTSFNDVKQYVFSYCTEDKAKSIKNTMGGYGAFCEYKGMLYAAEEEQLWWNSVHELYHLSASIRTEGSKKIVIDSSGRTRVFNECWYEADCLVLINTGNGYKFSNVKEQGKPQYSVIGKEKYETNVKSLDLSNKSLDDDDLSNLVYFTELEELKLTGNNLKTYWPIISCKKLKSLDVRDNDIYYETYQSGYNYLNDFCLDLKNIRK